MNLKTIVRFVAALCVAVTSATASAQLQLTCPIKTWGITRLDDDDQDKIILGVKARDWKKEYLDQVLAKAVECEENISDKWDSSGSLKKINIDSLKNHEYPNWIAAIEHRDQKQQKKLDREARSQQAAEESQRNIGVQSKRANDLQIQADQQSAEESQRNIEAMQKRTRDQQIQEDQQTAKEQQRADEARQQQIEQSIRDKEADTKRQAEAQKSQNLWILAVVIAAVFSGWCWNKFFRNRCPSCKSSSYDTVNVTETDRFRGSKQITESHSRGTNTRHVQVTYVKKLYEFHCKTCQHEWEKERKEELGANLILTRILSGFY